MRGNPTRESTLKITTLGTRIVKIMLNLTKVKVDEI